MSARRASGDPNQARRRGRLTHEDLTLWAEVARSASPLHGQARLRGSTTLGDAPGPRMPAAPPKLSRADPASARVPRPASVPEPIVRVLRARDPGPVGRPEPGLDRRTAQRIRRGEREPDGRIDLHGMTAERAHRALDQFVGASATCGHRLLLVITGKGRKGTGMLRDAVPGWLRAGPLGNRILGIWQAHQRHGGSGALYVYLRKPAKGAR